MPIGGILQERTLRGLWDRNLHAKEAGLARRQSWNAVTASLSRSIQGYRGRTTFKVVLFVVLPVLMVRGVCVCDISELASFDWRQFQTNDTVESCSVIQLVGDECLRRDVGSGVCVLATQSCLTLCDSMDYSPPGPSVHGILQARILE